MILPGNLIDGLDSGVVVLDPGGRVRVWNAWIAGRSGIAAGGALGRTLPEIFPSLLGSHLLAAIDRALGNGLPTVMSHNLHPRVLPLYSRHGKDMEPLEQSVVVRPMADGDGGRGCLIQVSDITAAVRRDRHLRDLTVYNRTLFEMAVDAMATVAGDGTLIDVNPAFESLTGIARQSLAGVRFATLFTKPAEAARLIAGAVAQGHASDVLLSIRRSSGSLRHVSLSAATVPSRAEGGHAVFLVARDQTQQIEAARELVRKTRLIERSNAELEQFAHVVSHDLRQPLRTVSSFLSLIERRLGAEIDEELKEFIGLAVDGARRMDRLIVELLDYSRVGRQDAPPESVALAEVMAEARANLAGAIGEAGATVTVPDGLPVVRGCRGEMVRLFQNLIANAIAYAAPDRAPQVDILCADQGETWLLAVRDNGIGIAVENLDRVFGLFQRLGMSGAEGSGIGLAVCRKIVERHRGRIWAESAHGQGSTFLVSLPKDL